MSELKTRHERTCEMYRDEFGVWHCKECENGADKITGSSGELDSWNDSWSPNYCPNCGAKVYGATEQSAIEAWNARAREVELESLVRDMWFKNIGRMDHCGWCVMGCYEAERCDFQERMEELGIMKGGE
jgi:hypothetical protein